jgi:hypothetical protein
MKRIAIAFMLFLGSAFSALAQAQPAPTPQVSSFSVTANAVSLPGTNNSTLAGSLLGASLKITPNFNLEQANFITSGAQTNVFLGGGSYTFNRASKALNNVSPTMNGYDFRFSIHGYGGEARINGNAQAAAMFGGQVDYAIKGSSTYSMAVRVDDLFVPKGLPHKNNLVVAVGPSIHF